MMMVIFMLLAAALIVTLIPVDGDNTSTDIIEISNGTNSIQNNPMINENAATANPIVHGGPNIEVIVDEERVSEEAVDDRPDYPDSIAFDALLNETEEEVRFSTTVYPYEDNEVETNGDWEENSETTSDSDSSVDGDDLISENRSDLGNAVVQVSGEDERNDSDLSPQGNDNINEDDENQAISTDDRDDARSGNNALADDIGENIVIESQNIIDSDFHLVFHQDVSSDQLLTTDKSTDVLTDAERSEVMSSLDVSGIEQPSSSTANSRLDEIAPSSLASDYDAHVMDPSDLAELQVPADVNTEHDDGHEQTNSVEDPLHPGDSNALTGQVIPPSAITSAYVENNGQSDQTSAANEVGAAQALPADVSFDRKEETTVEESEEMGRSACPTGFDLQKQSSSAGDAGKERPKETIM